MIPMGMNADIVHDEAGRLVLRVSPTNHTERTMLITFCAGYGITFPRNDPAPTITIPSNLLRAPLSAPML